MFLFVCLVSHCYSYFIIMFVIFIVVSFLVFCCVVLQFYKLFCYWRLVFCDMWQDLLVHLFVWCVCVCVRIYFCILFSG